MKHEFVSYSLCQTKLLVHGFMKRVLIKTTQKNEKEKEKKEKRRERKGGQGAKVRKVEETKTRSFEFLQYRLTKLQQCKGLVRPDIKAVAMLVPKPMLCVLTFRSFCCNKFP